MKRMAVAAEYDTTSTPVSGRASERGAGPERVTISIYENDVPAFIEAEMDRIYGSIYSSLAQFRIYNDGRDTSTYIVREGGETVTVFLFQLHDRSVRVVNEVINIGQEDVARFAHYIFSAFPFATSISFKAVDTDLRKLPFPYQRFNHLEDIVLTLPASADEYLAQLGKNTRRNIKRYTKKVKETFPSFEFQIGIAGEIDETTIHEIVDLNRARMAGKNKVSSIDQHEAERFFSLARECGLVGVVKINGRICAGAISFRAGSNYFLNVIAHDPQYDDYWLGILCCYFTICECIAREGAEFHFLWGEYDYKYAFLGVKRDLDNLAVYRSRLHYLLNGRTALRMAFNGYLRQARQWLHNAKRQDSPLSKIALSSFNRLRGVKQDFLARRRR